MPPPLVGRHLGTAFARPSDMGNRDPTPDRSGPDIEHFEADECRRRLREGGVGRIAMRGDEAPELRPVNFVLRDDVLILRTGDGSIMTAARRSEAASFEIDGIDPFEHTG